MRDFIEQFFIPICQSAWILGPGVIFVLLFYWTSEAWVIDGKTTTIRQKIAKWLFGYEIRHTLRYDECVRLTVRIFPGKLSTPNPTPFVRGEAGGVITRYRDPYWSWLGAGLTYQDGSFEWIATRQDPKRQIKVDEILYP